MKPFTKGVLVGAGTVIASAAAAVLTFKTRVIDPIEVEQQRIDENRKKAMRKSYARS